MNETAKAKETQRERQKRKGKPDRQDKGPVNRQKKSQIARSV